MATAKKSARKTSAPKAKTARKTAGTKTRTRSTATNSRKSTAKGSSSRRRRGGDTAHKTGRTSAQGKAATDKHSDNPSSTGHGKAKKEPAKQTSQCWPGYEPVPGKARGTKGSCEPKAHQTGAEKKSDGMAAAASKLRRAGGNKAKANHSK